MKDPVLQEMKTCIACQCLLWDPKLGKVSTMHWLKKSCYNLVGLKSICSQNTKSVSITQCAESPELSNTLQNRVGQLGRAGLLYIVCIFTH